MRTFGLTGGIGTGKSTVAALLREHGIPVLDADQAARAVVAPGTPGLEAIVSTFGEEVLTESGDLDRPRMRVRIMADSAARQALEGITHPLIFAHIAGGLRDLADDGHGIAGVEAALMVETGSYRMYDALVVVTCSPEVQVQRVIARDTVDEAAARSVIATQLPLEDKEAVATWVVRNDTSLEALKAEVDRIAALLGDMSP